MVLLKQQVEQNEASIEATKAAIKSERECHIALFRENANLEQELERTKKSTQSTTSDLAFFSTSIKNYSLPFETIQSSSSPPSTDEKSNSGDVDNFDTGTKQFCSSDDTPLDISKAC
jgi:hypothetical protein